MPLMRSGKLTAPSWCCAAPESAMSWVSVSFVPLRVVISASIRLKSGHVRPVTTATPLRPLDQRGSFEADGSPCASALLMRTAICGISALKGRVSGAGLCSPFSNFRLAVAETGSIADRDRFAGRTSGIRRTPARSPQRRQTLWPTCDGYLERLFQAIARPRSTSRVTIRCSAPARSRNRAEPWDVKLRAGDAAGALAAYEEGLGIARKLAADKNLRGAANQD